MFAPLAGSCLHSYFLCVCWFCSMTGNPIITVIVVIIIITTQVGTQKFTYGKLRHEDCSVLLVSLVAYFYDWSVFSANVSPCLLEKSKQSHLSSSPIFVDTSDLFIGKWAGSKAHLFPHWGAHKGLYDSMVTAYLYDLPVPSDSAEHVSWLVQLLILEQLEEIIQRHLTFQSPS